MARTLDQVLTELNAAYLARAEMMQGKKIARIRFASAETSRHYEFSDLVTYEQLQAYISGLEAERDMLDNNGVQVYRTYENVPMTYRKGGL